MKKVKIMLASMAIVALVGSGLAVKAARFGTVIFTGTSATSCPNRVLNSTFTPSTTSTIFATTAGGNKASCVRATLSTQL